MADWALRIQLLTYDASDSIVELMRFPVALLPESPLRANMFASGRTRRLQCKSLARLERALATQHWNAVRLSRRFGVDDDEPMRNIDAVLQLSPTHSLWDDARAAKAHRPVDEMMRLSMESKQIAVRSKGILEYPTAIDVRVSFACPGLQEAETVGTKWICDALEASRFTLDIVGVADLSAGMEQPTWTDFASAVGTARSENAAAVYDDLHWILIARESVCREIASMIGHDVPIVKIASATPAICFLRLPTEVAWLRDARQKVSLLLLETKAGSRVAASPAQGWRFLSQNEYRRLDQEGLVPKLTGAETLHPLIAEQYQQLLGLSRADVLVIPMDRQLSATIHVETEHAFEKLDSVGDMRQRVSLAHETVLRKYISLDLIFKAFDQMELPRSAR